MNILCLLQSNIILFLPVDDILVGDRDSEVDGAGVIEYSTTLVTIINALLALLIGVYG